MTQMADDNPLAGIDLQAWTATEPSPEFGDALRARLAAVAAVQPASTGRPRRAFVGTAVALVAVAAIAAVITVIVVRPDAPAAIPATGELTADDARSLELGTARGELEPHAHIAWRHDGGTLIVDERGAATWTIARADLTLGAQLPVLHATDASLRVDARATGATVTVFRGQVIAGERAAAVMIEPGRAIELGAATSRVGAVPASCDSAALVARGKELIAAGKYPDAVLVLEAALSCRADPTMFPLVVLSACNAGDAPTARSYYAKLAPAQRPAALEICVRNGIQLDCDAPALVQRGKDQINVGAYAPAVISLEASLRCHDDPALNRLVLLAACNSANAIVARRYFLKLPRSQQAAASQMCIRNKIQLP